MSLLLQNKKLSGEWIFLSQESSHIPKTRSPDYLHRMSGKTEALPHKYPKNREHPEVFETSIDMSLQKEYIRAVISIMLWCSHLVSSEWAKTVNQATEKGCGVAHVTITHNLTETLKQFP